MAQITQTTPKTRRDERVIEDDNFFARQILAVNSTSTYRTIDTADGTRAFRFAIALIFEIFTFTIYSISSQVRYTRTYTLLQCAHVATIIA